MFLLLLNERQTLHTVKIDFASYLAFWDLSITNIVKNVLLSYVGKSHGRKMMTGLLRSKKHMCQ